MINFDDFYSVSLRPFVLLDNIQHPRLWVEENIGSEYYIKIHGTRTEFLFKLEEDAALFKMQYAEYLCRSKRYGNIDIVKLRRQTAAEYNKKLLNLIEA